ncbi:MAG: serine/threonine protein kinase [Deltaproteobacteria bacterium]|nr:MAG: serine/threonine protein kinase [Deltaproteobacteria bacterium]
MMLPSLVGKQVGRYRIEEVLGKGGMGVVYRAVDTLLEREVAFKTIRTDFLEEKDPQERAEFIRRFQREAKNLARHEHENILEIYDFSGADSELVYLVTKLIRGKDLGTLLSEGRTYLRIPLMIVSQICSALSSIHAEGIVHRDLKPGNIMVEKTGRAYLLDFGLSKDTHAATKITNNQILGTLDYMAPEQLLDQPISPATDIFAMGVILYEISTGRLPFEGKLYSKIQRIVEGSFLPPRKFVPSLDPRVERLVLSALRHESVERFTEITALKTEIDEYLAEIGITDPVAELSAFLGDRSAYEAAFRGRLLEAGERFLEGGEEAAAQACAGELLSVDPHDEEVLAWVERSGFSLSYDPRSLEPPAFSKRSGLSSEVQSPATETVATPSSGVMEEETEVMPSGNTPFSWDLAGEEVVAAVSPPTENKVLFGVLILALLILFSVASWYFQRYVPEPEVSGEESVMSGESVGVPTEGKGTKGSPAFQRPPSPVHGEGAVSPPPAAHEAGVIERSAPHHGQTSRPAAAPIPSHAPPQGGREPAAPASPKEAPAQRQRVETPSPSATGVPFPSIRIIGMLRAEIEIDGLRYDSQKKTKPIPLSPGTYRVKFTFAGKPPVYEDVTVTRPNQLLNVDRVYWKHFKEKHPKERP